MTPEVRQYLDSHGNFVLPPAASPGTRSIISTRKAGDLAVAFLHTFVEDADTSLPLPPNALHLRHVLESQHGRPVDWSRIAAASQGPYYAVTPYGPLPDELDRPIHSQYGPHFLVPILSDGHQVAVVAVAAYATDYLIDDGGRLTLPEGLTGGAFDAYGILYFHPYRYPVMPERAVRIVVERFQSRVSEIPRLLQGGLRRSPAGVNWELRLEEPVDVRLVTTGEVVRTSRVYVGQWPSLIDPTSDEGPFLQIRFFVADEEQPTTESISYWDPETEHAASLQVPYVDGIPVRFLAVEPASG